MSVLDRYTGPEAERVRLACLKLAEEQGDADPSRWVEAANRDYRDVLYWAEYPHQARRGYTSDPAEQARLSTLDAAQYQAWLKRKKR